MDQTYMQAPMSGTAKFQSGSHTIELVVDKFLCGGTEPVITTRSSQQPLKSITREERKARKAKNKAARQARRNNR